eukprot:TRINITY_DN1883_c0_g1_i4.p1 TRINITY_DN1883_c0_g1~~TRINITY_DN1883_c0_g1_i4.p1  ORF type:complete len:1335 (+),score=281.69 TRINITY_DN1883_c0_g1_i4:125-4129(+)
MQLYIRTFTELGSLRIDGDADLSELYRQIRAITSFMPRFTDWFAAFNGHVLADDGQLTVVQCGLFHGAVVRITPRMRAGGAIQSAMNAGPVVSLRNVLKSEEDVLAVFKEMETNTTITDLDMRTLPGGEATVQRYTDVNFDLWRDHFRTIARNSKVRTLSVDFWMIRPFLERLSASTTLTTLNVSHLSSVDDWHRLLRFTLQTATLLNVCVKHSAWSPDLKLDHILVSLLRQNRVQSLPVVLGERTVVLDEALAHNTSLTHLQLFGEVHQLKLSAMRSLRSLYLHPFSFGMVSDVMLLSNIVVFSGLKVLKIRGDVDSGDIARLLQLPRLRVLAVRNNVFDIDERVLQGLVQSKLKRFSHAAFLSDSIGTKMLCDVLSRNTALTSLKLKHLHLADPAAASAAVSGNFVLRRLHLGGSTPQWAERYIQRNLALAREASVVVRRTRLVLIGDGRVGKTCLLRRLRGESFLHKSSETDSLELGLWEPAGADMTFATYDCGGQQVYALTHSLFLQSKEPCVCLLVCNGQETSAQHLSEWYSLIRAATPSCPIVIVSTHCEQQDAHQRQLQLPSSLAECEVFKVSNLTGDGVDVLRTAVLRLATTVNSVMRLTVPMYKLMLDLQTSAKTLPLLPQSEITAKAAHRQISAKSLVKALSIFHHRSILFWFRQVSDLVFLQPSYLIDVLRCLVSITPSAAALAAKGILTLSDLAQVWQSFPVTLHTQLLKVTQHLGVTCPLIERDSCSITKHMVPVLLPGIPSAEFLSYSKRQALFKRHIRLTGAQVLLQSVRARVIAAQWRIAVPDTWWQSGVVVQQAGHHVVVQFEQNIIMVTGLPDGSLPLVTLVCQSVVDVLTKSNCTCKCIVLCTRCQEPIFASVFVAEKLPRSVRCQMCCLRSDSLPLTWSLGSLLALDLPEAASLAGEYTQFPLQHRASAEDIALLQQSQSSFTQANLLCLERLGRRKEAIGGLRYNGSNTVVYLAKLRGITGLSDPDRLYAVKVIRNVQVFAHLPEEEDAGFERFLSPAEIELQRAEIARQGHELDLRAARAACEQESRLAAQQSRFTSRVICSFVVDRIDIAVLPDWEDPVLHGHPAAVLVLDLFEPSNDMTQFPIAHRMLQLMHGIAELQQLKRCHRDLKMDNVMLDCASGWLQIVDFGEALQCDESFCADIGGGAIAGVPDLAPALAQADGRFNYSGVDMFCAGDNICTEWLKQSPADPVAAHLIEQMCVTDRHQRLQALDAIAVLEWHLWCRDTQAPNQAQSTQEQVLQWQQQRRRALVQDLCQRKLQATDMLQIEFLRHVTVEQLQRRYDLYHRLMSASTATTDVRVVSTAVAAGAVDG